MIQAGENVLGLINSETAELGEIIRIWTDLQDKFTQEPMTWIETQILFEIDSKGKISKSYADRSRFLLEDVYRMGDIVHQNNIPWKIVSLNKEGALLSGPLPARSVKHIKLETLFTQYKSK